MVGECSQQMFAEALLVGQKYITWGSRNLFAYRDLVLRSHVGHSGDLSLSFGSKHVFGRSTVPAARSHSGCEESGKKTPELWYGSLSAQHERSCLTTYWLRRKCRRKDSTICPKWRPARAVSSRERLRLVRLAGLHVFVRVVERFPKLPKARPGRELTSIIRAVPFRCPLRIFQLGEND